MRAADRAQAWLEAVDAAFDLGIDVTVLAVGLGLAVLALALWVAWRRPALMFVPALASLAIRPQLLWGDRNVGGRTFDVQETTPGVIALSGRVRSEEERRRALAVAGHATDLREIEDRLSIEAEPVRRRRLVALLSR